MSVWSAIWQVTEGCSPPLNEGRPAEEGWERGEKRQRGKGGRVILLRLCCSYYWDLVLGWFFSLVACFCLRRWDWFLCCQLKLGLYPADSRQWQRGTLGSPSAHWRSSVTGLEIENSTTRFGARVGVVGLVAGMVVVILLIPR